MGRPLVPRRRTQMKLARAAWCVALLAGVMPAVVKAQGFQLNEIGSCALARGQAVTAAPCNDASAIYWNPAATTSLSGWSAYFGAAWINVRGSYTSDTTGTSTPGAVPPAFPPNIFVNYTAPSHKWAAGHRRVRALRTHVAVAERLPGQLHRPEGRAGDDLRPAELRLLDQQGLVDRRRIHLWLFDGAVEGSARSVDAAREAGRSRSACSAFRSSRSSGSPP